MRTDVPDAAGIVVGTGGLTEDRIVFLVAGAKRRPIPVLLLTVFAQHPESEGGPAKRRGFPV